jgi:putative nucleotidyltransferase-like protein
VTIAPEIELLVLCLRAAHAGTDVSGAIAERAAAITDWGSVLRAAVAHSLTPVLVRELEASGAISSLPARADAELRASQRACVERGLSMSAEMVRLSNVLASAGVRAVPFKGPVLSALLYGDVAMREYLDLDLLVDPADLVSAVGRLVDDGYRTQLSLSAVEIDRLARRGYEIGFTDATGRVVELEWAIAPGFFGIRVPISQVIERARPVQVGGVKLATPCLEDLLLLLCVHGGKHLWERLAWIRDVAALIDGSRLLDASAVLDRAHDAHVKRMLLVGLWLAELVAAVPAPDGFRDAMAADPEARRVAIRLRTEIGSVVPDRPRPDPPFRPLHLRLRERRRDRVAHVVRLACTPTLEDWRTLRLPPVLSFGYYLIRPFRLIGKYAFGGG